MEQTGTQVHQVPKEAGIYIHIPFCEHKCIYCDFYSVITTEKVREYIDALLLEFAAYEAPYAKSHHFSSIFFGGGTPSSLPPEIIGEIIQALYHRFSFTDDVEITMETNPGTVNDEKLKQFRAVGINRISVGIQSFDDKDLAFLTRIHDAQTAITTVHSLVTAGFDNISIDLIFNLPGQTREAWTKNLVQASKLPVKHISAYSLILERGTILNKMVLDKKVVISDADFDADLYEITMDHFISHGLTQYEVSNFCVPGFECRHNNHYWQYRDYLSFGTSSHSFMNGKRWWNISSLTFYLLSMQQHGHARAGEELLTVDQMHDEYVMLAFRSAGLNRREYESRFGNRWLTKTENELTTLIRNGYLKEEGGVIRMLPKGYVICDEIIKKLL